MLLVALTLAACAGYRSAPPRSYSAEDPPAVHVVIYPPQNGLTGPARDCHPSLMPLAVFPGVNLYAQLLAGSLVQLWADQGRAVVQRALEGATNSYSLAGSLASRLQRSNTGTIWRVHGIEEAAFNEANTIKAARTVLAEEPVEFVLFLRPNWFMTRSLDALHLRVSVYVQQRPAYIDGDDAYARYSLQLEYVSDSRGELERDFDAGEKKALIEEMERELESQVAARPGEEKRLRRQHRELVNEIENSRRVPLPVAAAKIWPTATLHAELDRAADHVTYMLQTRLSDLGNPDAEPGIPAGFTVLDSQCMNHPVKGERVGSHDGHTIFRDADGDLYSLPEATQSAADRDQ